jgi:hypothetical protein
MNVVLAHTGPDKLPLERVAYGFNLTLGQVHAAMSYYYTHQDEMDAAQEAESAETARLVAELVQAGKVTVLSAATM